MWMYGPSTEEKSKRTHSFDKYPACSLPKKNKVCLVGTLNLCLRVPDKMQKTRGKSDPYRLRKLPKTAQKPQNMN